MPIVTINDRAVEVQAGTNLIEAANQVGIQIPHYCYHPRLSIVGQCRMCLVKVEGMPKLQAGCSTQVMKDGMVVRTDIPEVEEAQKSMMEFLLINHPLDCPICDQAGECGLQDYSFKHGVASSRFHYEDKRTYPQKERIPLGPTVLLNMNRCIQCTRCVRFTHEVAGTGELGFFQRGARAEIGTFPGKPLDNDLSTCVVDICPVGALTSTRFRFAERVWYLDKKPSICTGCDVGCNITVEHRRGALKRLKPRFNPAVNDYWMCDFGRGSAERYGQRPRLGSPRVRPAVEQPAVPSSWREALDLVARRLSAANASGAIAVLGSGFNTTEEAFALASLANQLGSPHRAVWATEGPERRIPNTHGGIRGRETSPNRRGAELAGLSPGAGGFDAASLVQGDAAARCSVLIVADSDLGPEAWDPSVVERLRKAHFLVVLGWADSPLAQAADVVLPVATAVERGGSFVNVAWRLQGFTAAFPPPAQVRPTVEVLTSWAGLAEAAVFDRLASAVPAFAGLTLAGLPATGHPLPVAPVAAGTAA
jgi:NADH-quinone oxidoreductase subunit G